MLAIVAETEALLSLRKRDLALSGELLALYRAESWKQRSKIVRAWMVWITFLSILAIEINNVMAPDIFWLGLVICGFCVPPINAVVYLIWRRPRSTTVEGLSITIWVASVTLCYSIVGIAAGGFDHERYLTATLFVTVVGVMVLGVQPVWTKAIAFVALAIFLTVQLLNPLLGTAQAIAMTVFYGLGFLATVIARRTTTINAERSFLMTLRDRHRSEALARANGALAELAAIDPLTGVANRRSAKEQIDRVWAGYRRADAVHAIVMADIDHFKMLNDALGHAAGDKCLTDVAKAIAGSVRATADVVSRHGGEEFLVLLTQVTRAEASESAERIRRAVEALAIPNPGAPGGVVTMSLGIAFADRDAGSERVTKWADDALYDAKRQGRNRVCLAPERDAAPTDAPPPLPLAKAS